MRQKNSDDVARHNGGDRREPAKARANDPNVDSKACGSKQIPAVSKRVGQKRDDVLTLDQQIGEVMGEVVGNRDRDQRQ